MNTALSFLVVSAAATMLLLTLVPTTLIGRYRSQLVLQLFIAFGLTYGVGLVVSVSPEDMMPILAMNFAFGLLLYAAVEVIALQIGRSQSPKTKKLMSETASLAMVYASLSAISSFEPLAHDKLFIVTIVAMAAYMVLLYLVVYRYSSRIMEALLQPLDKRPWARKPKVEEAKAPVRPPFEHAEANL